MGTGKLYSELVNRLEDIRRRLTKPMINSDLLEDEVFVKSIHELEDIVRDDRFASISSDIINSNLFRNLSVFFRKMYELFETFLETQTYLSNMEGGLDFGTPQIRRTFDFAKIEGQSAGINSSSKVLFVGCGPFPETAMAYATKLGCKVDCLDYNPEAVFLSRVLVNKIGLGKMIEVLYGDAKEVNYDGYTHVVIAALARPKGAILERICKTSEKEVTVVCRTVGGLKALIYEPIEDFFLEHFDIVDKIVGARETILHSLILKHKPHHSIVYEFLDKTLSSKVRDFCLKLIKEEYGFDYRKDWHMDLDLLGTSNDYYSFNQRGCFILAQDSGNIIGTGGLRSLTTKPALAKKFTPRYTEIDKVGSLWRVYIDSSQRMKKIASEIVGRLESQAKKYGYDVLYLHTSRDNPSAINFWEKKGYSIFLEEDNEDRTVHMDKHL